MEVYVKTISGTVTYEEFGVIIAMSRKPLFTRHHELSRHLTASNKAVANADATW